MSVAERKIIVKDLVTKSNLPASDYVINLRNIAIHMRSNISIIIIIRNWYKPRRNQLLLCAHSKSVNNIF